MNSKENPMSNITSLSMRAIREIRALNRLANGEAIDSIDQETMEVEDQLVRASGTTATGPTGAVATVAECCPHPPPPPPPAPQAIPQQPIQQQDESMAWMETDEDLLATEANMLNRYGEQLKFHQGRVAVLTRLFECFRSNAPDVNRTAAAAAPCQDERQMIVNSRGPTRGKRARKALDFVGMSSNQDEKAKRHASKKTKKGDSGAGTPKTTVAAAAAAAEAATAAKALLHGAATPLNTGVAIPESCAKQLAFTAAVTPVRPVRRYRAVNVYTDSDDESNVASVGNPTDSSQSRRTPRRQYPVVNGIVADGEVASSSFASPPPPPARPTADPPVHPQGERPPLLQAHYSDISVCGSDGSDTDRLTQNASAQCDDNFAWLNNNLDLVEASDDCTWLQQYNDEQPLDERLMDVEGLEVPALGDRRNELLFLDMLYEQNIIGDGGAGRRAAGAAVGQGEVERVADDEPDGAGDVEPPGNAAAAAAAAANGAVNNNDDDDDDADIEPHMIFAGDNFAVNFHRHINVQNVRELEFAAGAVRETVYRVHFDVNWIGVNLRDIMGGLELMFTAIIARLNECYNGQDLVRLFIQNEAFYTPHSLGLLPLHELNVFKILELLESLLQSDEEIVLDEPLEVHVGVIRNPLAATQSSGVNYLQDMKRLRCVCEIRNTDNLCLARAIIVGIARANVDAVDVKDDEPAHRAAANEFKRLTHYKQPGQTIAAEKLHTDAGFELDYIPAFTDIPAFERAANVRVVVFGRGATSRPLYVGCDTRQLTVYLLYINNPLDEKEVGHFHTITKVNCILGKTGFCHKCLTAYDKRYAHTGCGQCFSCRADSCETVAGEKHCCGTCNRFMKSLECNRRHVENGVCAKSHRCKTCGVFYKTNVEHQCGSRECTICKKRVTGVHFCYIRQKKPKPVSSKYIFADFEADTTGDFHKPTLIVAHWQCEHCIETSYRRNPHCTHCGTACDKCSSNVDPRTPRGDALRSTCMGASGCGKRAVVFSGAETAIDFCKFLFRREFEGYTLIFHNGQAYDVYFMAKYIFATMKKVPHVIYRGSKIVALETGKFRIIDSLNFLSFPLSQMPKVFGLKDVKKGTFPILCDHEAFKDHVGCQPHPYYYGVNRMKPQAREEFTLWYAQQRGKVFDFKKELLAYCEDDVNILQESCNAFRSWLLGITSREEVIDIGEGGEQETRLIGIDPLQYNTLASVCMATYRYMFLEEKHCVELKDGRSVTGILQNDKLTLKDPVTDAVIDQSTVEVESMAFVSTPFARMPACGFGGLDAHSRVSILWLEYEAKKRKVPIKHARNGGEHRLRNQTKDGWFKLDGYHKDPDTGKETAWEFYGCVYHGCRKCYGGPNTDSTVRHPHTGESLKSLYKQTENRLAYLRKDMKMDVHVMWECEFRNMLKTNEQLIEMEKKSELLPRLDPREAFYGGRVNAVKLYREAAGDKKIGYVDICSLYPMVLKNDIFPVGIPEVIFNPPPSDIGMYFGIVQARIRPPRGLYHPCLPMRSGGKLLFPLCSKCARLTSKSKCTCGNLERDMVGTWTTIDIADAISVGYTVIKLYEVYHFKETAKFDKILKNPGLFSPYVNLFLKGKQEASGWPTPNMSQAEKEEYIRQYEAVEGIRLEENNIIYNPGKRATNKLLLNSFWGKFGENNNHRTHKIAETAGDVLKVMANPSFSMKGMHILGPDRCMLEYAHSEGFLPEVPHVNVFIAAFTTANARSRLFKVLNSLGERVIYFDTDSVVYEYTDNDPTQYTPDIGDHLGQWTNELREGQYITKFVSSGPKSYAFVTNDGMRTTKLKGFTLNHEVSKKLNFDSIAELVLFWAAPDEHPLKDSEEPHVEVTFGKIRRNKHEFKLFSREEVKKFRVTYSKRCLIPNTFDTIPFGF